MAAKTSTATFKQETAAILIMMTGWGWIAGNFGAPFDTFWIGAVTAIGHSIPIVLLLICSLQFLSIYDVRQRPVTRSNWGGIGITILALLAIIGSIILIMLGASNSNPNAVGVKTLQDYMPVIVLNIGAFWWLVLVLPLRRQGREITARSKE